jgi:hypothetical protein
LGPVRRPVLALLVVLALAALGIAVGTGFV